MLGPGIPKPYSFEDNALSDRNRNRGCPRFQPNARLDLEEAEQIIEVEALLEDLRQRQQDSLDEIATLPERAGEKREHADREEPGGPAVADNR